jgi:hypothetical protein
MAIRQSICCGAPLITDVQCSACGATGHNTAVENTIQRVVKAHDALCLDADEERARLIAALASELCTEDV